MPVQIDGEPWMQGPGKVIVRPTLSQAVMLTKTKAKLKNTRALTPSHQSSRSSSIFYKDWT
ncbi:hypothetical protein P5673_017124 [Acropora cervicornis]|uniref:Diacylglycerol kinase n=2 Tax=Acropora TaxID=6127 RepID=A0AAD9V482_ACRCE|nr:hypothetical protein P5673_017124 [Acropora cervicornis]